MSNIYTVVNYFNEALENAGFSVNNLSMESTTDLRVGGEILTHPRSITLNEEQVAGHVTYDIEYIIQLYQAHETEDSTPYGTETKSKENAVADNFDSIIQTIYRAVGASDAENVHLTDGEIFFVVAEEYQCFAGIAFRITFRTLVI